MPAADTVLRQNRAILFVHSDSTTQWNLEKLGNKEKESYKTNKKKCDSKKKKNLKKRKWWQQTTEKVNILWYAKQLQKKKTYFSFVLMLSNWVWFFFSRWQLINRSHNVAISTGKWLYLKYIFFYLFSLNTSCFFFFFLLAALLHPSFKKWFTFIWN